VCRQLHLVRHVYFRTAAVEHDRHRGLPPLVKTVANAGGEVLAEERVLGLVDLVVSGTQVLVHLHCLLLECVDTVQVGRCSPHESVPAVDNQPSAGLPDAREFTQRFAYPAAVIFGEAPVEHELQGRRCIVCEDRPCHCSRGRDEERLGRTLEAEEGADGVEVAGYGFIYLLVPSGSVVGLARELVDRVGVGHEFLVAIDNVSDHVQNYFLALMVIHVDVAYNCIELHIGVRFGQSKLKVTVCRRVD